MRLSACIYQHVTDLPLTQTQGWHAEQDDVLFAVSSVAILDSWQKHKQFFAVGTTNWTRKKRLYTCADWQDCDYSCCITDVSLVFRSFRPPPKFQTHPNSVHHQSKPCSALVVVLLHVTHTYCSWRPRDIVGKTCVYNLTVLEFNDPYRSVACRFAGIRHRCTVGFRLRLFEDRI